ncbi:MAG: twin-arginine translocase TatA/TatE family subunit [Alphaproteobacteria bacterium]|nr:twin-arginine translocase TatA/TatE family subunit [Alphaproteobacteria bacterium]
MPGFWELVLIAVIVFFIFGAGRLPRLMGDLAQGIKSFKQGMKDDASSDKEKPQ